MTRLHLLVKPHPLVNCIKLCMYVCKIVCVYVTLPDEGYGMAIEAVEKKNYCREPSLSVVSGVLIWLTHGKVMPYSPHFLCVCIWILVETA